WHSLCNPKRQRGAEAVYFQPRIPSLTLRVFESGTKVSGIGLTPNRSPIAFSGDVNGLAMPKWDIHCECWFRESGRLEAYPTLTTAAV
ncbi:MAG: hypothetical protein WCO86_12325, partial [Planctomycetota bacterium]